MKKWTLGQVGKTKPIQTQYKANTNPKQTQFKPNTCPPRRLAGLVRHQCGGSEAKSLTGRHRFLLNAVQSRYFHCIGGSRSSGIQPVDNNDAHHLRNRFQFAAGGDYVRCFFRQVGGQGKDNGCCDKNRRRSRPYCRWLLFPRDNIMVERRLIYHSLHQITVSSDQVVFRQQIYFLLNGSFLVI